MTKAVTPLRARVQALEALFRRIECTRMAGLPLLNGELHVEALGFEPILATDELPAAVGVLLTPWFMNLVWLPLQPRFDFTAIGQPRERTIGNTRFEFIAACESGFGAYEACSLASPMFEYANQEHARTTAGAVLGALRAATPAAVSSEELAQPARRGFLFGRSALESRA